MKSTEDLIHFRGSEMKRGRSGDDLAFMAPPWGESSTARQALGQVGARSNSKRLPIVYLAQNPYFFKDEIRPSLLGEDFMSSHPNLS